MKTGRAKLFALVSIVACVVFGGILLFGYFRHPTITLGDGRSVPDLSVAESGVWAGDQYKELRTSYLKSLEFYKTLPMRPVEDDFDATVAAVRRLLNDQVSASPQNAAVVESLGKGVLDDLSRRVALALHDAAGMPLDEYESRLDPRMRLEVPANLIKETEPETFAGGPPDEGQVRALFQKLYKRYADDRGATVVDYTAGSDGALLALRKVASNRRLAGVDPDSWSSEEQYEHFQGHLSNGCLVFHQPPQTWESVAAKYPELPRAVVALVVTTGDGDRYPLWMEFYFDQGDSRWWLVGVFRSVSVVAAQAPPIAL